MRYRYREIVPARVMVLSLLLPPRAYDPLAPFGFGAFIVTRGLASEATFSTGSHGFGAGYDPLRMRERIANLLTPDTRTLIHVGASQGARALESIEKTSARYLDFVPRVGLVTVTRMIIPRSGLMAAAGIGNIVQLPARTETPIQRLRYIGLEAETAWLWWLFAASSPARRRNLLAAYTAWSALQRAQARLMNVE